MRMIAAADAYRSYLARQRGDARIAGSKALAGLTCLSLSQRRPERWKDAPNTPHPAPGRGTRRRL